MQLAGGSSQKDIVTKTVRDLFPSTGQDAWLGLITIQAPTSMTLHTLLTYHFDVVIHGKVMSKLSISVIISSDKKARPELTVSVKHPPDLMREIRRIVEFSHRVICTMLSAIRGH
jgi:hypothetical protein